MAGYDIIQRNLTPTRIEKVTDSSYRASGIAQLALYWKHFSSIESKTHPPTLSSVNQYNYYPNQLNAIDALNKASFQKYPSMRIHGY